MENLAVINPVVTFEVSQNKWFGDYRVDKYLNGEWVNQRDGNWTKEEAEFKASLYRVKANKGMNTMSDNF